MLTELNIQSSASFVAQAMQQSAVAQGSAQIGALGLPPMLDNLPGNFSVSQITDSVFGYPLAPCLTEAGAACDLDKVPSLQFPVDTPISKRAGFALNLLVQGAFGERGLDWIRHNPIANFTAQLAFFRNPAFYHMEDSFVLKSKDVLWRYLDSTSEKRMMISLHRHPFNNSGPYVTMAMMGPNYEQPFHSHALAPEFNFFVDGGTIKIRGERNLHANILVEGGSMVYIAPEIVHTVKNRSSSLARNLTVKPVFDPRIMFGEATGGVCFSLFPTAVRKGVGVNLSQYDITTSGGFRYLVQHILVPKHKEVLIPHITAKKKHSDEVLIALSDSPVDVLDGGRQMIMDDNDVLYVRHNDGYVLSNYGSGTAKFYRAVILENNTK